MDSLSVGGRNYTATFGTAAVMINRPRWSPSPTHLKRFPLGARTRWVTESAIDSNTLLLLSPLGAPDASAGWRHFTRHRSIRT
jgi:hypothetical protein